MSARRSLLFGAIGGAAAAALVLAAARIYGQRTLGRKAGAEAIELPDVATAFGRIAAMPQMRLLRYFAIRRALALRGAPDAAGHAVDLGCGPGHLAVELAAAAPGLNVTGVDLSTPLLGAAQRRALEAGLAYRLDFRTADVASTPFARASVDLVVSTLSLHHWANPVAVLNEVARIVRPGGAFMIFDLRRDLLPPCYLLIWFASRFVVPHALRSRNEPMTSRNAAYTPAEAAALAQASQLTGWRIATGPFWLSIDGVMSL